MHMILQRVCKKYISRQHRYLSLIVSSQYCSSQPEGTLYKLNLLLVTLSLVNTLLWKLGMLVLGQKGKTYGTGMWQHW